MYFSTLIMALATASLAAAQTYSAPPQPTSGYSICAQNIVDTCLAQYQKQVDACNGNDWICLCDNYTQLLQCYINCPESPNKPPVQNQVTQFCLAAAPFKSASLAAAATMPRPSTASSTAGAMATGSLSTSASLVSATGFATQTGAAVVLGITAAPLGGALAAVLGLLGLF